MHVFILNIFKNIPLLPWWGRDGGHSLRKWCPRTLMVMWGAIDVDVLCGYCSTVMTTLFSVLIPMLQLSSTFCLSLSSNPWAPSAKSSPLGIPSTKTHFYLTYKVKHYKSTLENVHRSISCIISLFIQSSEQFTGKFRFFTHKKRNVPFIDECRSDFSGWEWERSSDIFRVKIIRVA